MSINEILIQTGMTKYRLQKLSGVPHATLSDLCSGKTQIEKWSGETLYRLAKALQVPMAPSNTNTRCFIASRINFILLFIERTNISKLSIIFTIFVPK